jgi:hypothetical protein
MKKTSSVLLVLVLSAGCSSMKVLTDYSEAADFGAFETFQYKEGDQTIADTNQMVHDRIVGAIKRAMEANGFTEVNANPDVYVTYYGEETQQVVLQTTHMGYGYGSSWRWGGSMSHSTTRPTTYRYGTLVIDIVTAEGKELVWRGSATDTISKNPEKNTAKINRGIEKLFERYPPATGS